MTALPNLTPILPELVLAGSTLALLMIGVFRGDGATRMLSWLTVVALLAAGIVVSYLALRRVPRVVPVPVAAEPLPRGDADEPVAAGRPGRADSA